MVHIGEEVVALVICHLGYIHCQSQSQGRMARIATALVHLTQLAVSAFLQFALAGGHYEVAQELRQSVAPDGLAGDAVVTGDIVQRGRFGVVAYLIIFDK